jgi:hydroxyacylglutathione hydrolase
MPVTIETVVTGPMGVDTYVICCDQQCVVVDPGGMAGLDPLPELLARRELVPDEIWLTHGHGDHIAGITALRELFPDATICCPTADAAMLDDPALNLSSGFGLLVRAPQADRLVSPGETLTVGQSQWTVLDTSGHTPGGVSYYCPAAKAVLVGDALFAGSIGRTDFPGADQEQLLGNIATALLSLPSETAVLPGHGPASTIGREKTSNPFLR